MKTSLQTSLITVSSSLNSTTLKFKSLFENQKRELLLANHFSNGEFSVKQDELSDEMDLATSELDQTLRIKIRSREASMLKKIDLALSKIKDGTFGICECCDEQIELSRLEVRPVAGLCLGCKEIEENSESKQASGKIVRRIA
jgi:DnaK suppressor protein